MANVTYYKSTTLQPTLSLFYFFVFSLPEACAKKYKENMKSWARRAIEKGFVTFKVTEMKPCYKQHATESRCECVWEEKHTSALYRLVARRGKTEKRDIVRSNGNPERKDLWILSTRPIRRRRNWSPFSSFFVPCITLWNPTQVKSSKHPDIIHKSHVWYLICISSTYITLFDNSLATEGRFPACRRCHS